MITFQGKRYAFFIMTSGLRSVRDKAMTYFEEAMEKKGSNFDRLFKVVNLLATQVRQVSAEDRQALHQGGFDFNINALIGGQMANDKEPKLYLLYPQGNWVEVDQGTPYQIIGSTPYGKPVLDRTLKYTDPMSIALKVGCLAFDSTRISAADVDFPADVVLYRTNSFEMVEKRLEKEDLKESSDWWQNRLRQSVNELPTDWMDEVFTQLKGPIHVISGRVKNKS